MGFLWLQHFNAPWKEENAYVRKKSFAETVKELFTGESRGKAPSDKKKKKKK